MTTSAVARQSFPTWLRLCAAVFLTWASTSVIGVGVSTVSVSAAPTVIFSENFDSMNQGGTGTQAHTGLTVGYGGSAAGWSVAGQSTIHNVDRLLNSDVNIAATFYRDNVITLSSGVAANTTGLPYTLAFDIAPSVWASPGQASNSTDGLIVQILRADGAVLATSTQYSGQWYGTVKAQNNFVRRSFSYTGDGSGTVRIKVSTINPSADRFGGAIDNITLSQVVDECAPTISTVESGSVTVARFTSVGTCKWTVPGGTNSVEYLVVGGGGGGGGDASGGGGAGGLLTNYTTSTLSVTPGSSVAIAVGDGGVAGQNGPGNRPSDFTESTQGGDSQFGSLIAFGGGYGGIYNSNNGGPGGSGGGGAYGSGTGGPGTSGQGNAGGNSNGGGSGPAGAGGGGAGGIGIAGNVEQGQGGPGRSVAITGVATTYAGGGGGGRWNVNGSAPGANNGGAGGGGAGSIGCGNAASPGIDNTGGGGGGAPAGCEGLGARGGSGIVIVRYSSPVAPVNSAAPTIAGTNRVGETLTATSGTWSGSPTSYSYQWKRASTAGGVYSNIGAASSSNTYVLTDDDVDKFVKVAVIATNNVGPSPETLSVATSAISDLPASTTPAFSSRTSTATGFTFTITNYSNLYTYTVTTSSGSVARVGDDVTVTGLASGASATVTVRATRSGYLASTAQVSGTAILAVTTTTVKAAVVIDIQAPVTTVAQGQASVATIAPGDAQSATATASTIPAVTTTIAASKNGAQVSAPTTTLAPVQQTQEALVAPSIPKVDTGESALDLGGVKEKVAVTRENNQLIITSGALSARLSGLGKNGSTSPLDKEGNLQLEPGDVIRINVGGFKPESKVDVWFFSTPTHLGSTKVGADGTVSGAFRVPMKAEDGPHRIAITAKLENGKEATFTLGVRIGAIPQTSTLTRILIAIPIMMAIGAGLILPNQIRRRRRKSLPV